MPIDIRANVFCNLGPVISGNISDEPLTVGQGLIRCRGQIILKGLFTPSVGSVVTLGYEQDGKIARVPRVLRVLGSFADPFRNQTTVSLGDKLVWLADKNQAFKDIYPEASVAQPEQPNFPTTGGYGASFVDPLPYPDAKQTEATPEATQPRIGYEYTGVCWKQVELPETPPVGNPQAAVKSELSKDYPFFQQFDFSNEKAAQQVTAAEEYAKAPLKDFLAVKPSISANFIALKCLAGLGIGSRNLLLLNSYPNTEFDLTEGYVPVLEKLLSSEGQVGFLDETEMLVTTPIASAPATSVLLTEDDIIDVSPLNIGTPPSARVVALTTVEASKSTEQPPNDNIAPVANDVSLYGRNPNNFPLTVFASSLTQRGFDPDYVAQSAVAGTTQLQVESVTSGTGCTAVLTNPVVGVITVTPNSGFTGVASFTFTLTDGLATSNTATCYFQFYDPAGQQSTYDPFTGTSTASKNLQQRVDEAQRELAGVANGTRDSQDPSAQADPGAQKDQAKAQPESRQRNWEFDETQGSQKIVTISLKDWGDDFTFVNGAPPSALTYSYAPYSNSCTSYDKFDRVEGRSTRRDGIVADAAGNLVKKLIDLSIGLSESRTIVVTTDDIGSVISIEGKPGWANSFDSIGALPISWYTIEKYKYYTSFSRNEQQTEERSEFGEAYDDYKKREEEAWKQAMEADNAANTGPIPDACPLDFTPPSNPAAGATYEYDGKRFVFQSNRWRYDPSYSVPIADKKPPTIYASDLVRTQVETREVVYSWMLEQETLVYSPLAEVLGQIDLEFSEDFYYVPDDRVLLSDRTVIYYDVDYEAGKTKTITHRWTIGVNTAEGQQYLASVANEIGDYGTNAEKTDAFARMLDYATTLVYQGAEVQIRTDREYGIQQRPSVYEREWTDTYENSSADPDVFGDFTVVDINSRPPNQKVELEQEQPPDPTVAEQFPRNEQAQERVPDLKVVVPYVAGPRRTLASDLTAQFEETKAQQQALNYSRAVNAVARGNRYGMGLQFAAKHMPRKALDWMYVQIGGVGAAYRTNGSSWVFNESGILCNTDALFWGGVGGSGSPWFPLAQGINTMPPLPAVTSAAAQPANSIATPAGFDAANPGSAWTALPFLVDPVYAQSITPTALIPAFQERVPALGVTRLQLLAERYDYSLQVSPQIVVLTTSLPFDPKRVKLLAAEAASLLLNGQASALRYTRRMNAAAGSVALSGFGAGSIRDYRIGTNFGTFNWSGQNAALLYQRAALAGGAGSISLSGKNATLYKAIALGANAGSFALSGQASNGRRGYVLSSAAGTFAVTGQAATLITEDYFGRWSPQTYGYEALVLPDWWAD